MTGPWAAFTALLLLGGGCITRPPIPKGTSTGGDTTSDTAACYTCNLENCQLDDDPPDVSSESECSDAADDLECDDYSWDPC